LEKRYWNEREVAEYTGIGVSRLRSDRFLNRGIPYHKVGRSVKYDHHEMAAYLQAGRVETDWSEEMPVRKQNPLVRISPRQKVPNHFSMEVWWSASDGMFIATSPDWGQTLSALGDTQGEAATNLMNAIGLAIETMAEQGWPIPEPKES
jgi:predicted RNase H-like HicB family nuclease